MYRLLPLTLLLLVCAACGAAPAAQSPSPSASASRSPVARNQHTTTVPAVTDMPAAVEAHSPTPRADVIYLPMPTVEPASPRRPTAVGGMRLPLSSAQQVITALQAAGLAITIKAAPERIDQASQGTSFEYTSAALEADGQHFDIGIAVCPSKQACNDTYELSYKLALDGHDQIWRTPDGLILCITTPPAPRAIAITMKEVIEGK